MTHQLNCPACRYKLYFPSASNSSEYLLEGICCNCKHKYTLEQAEVTAFNSIVEALHSSTYSSKVTTEYKRLYQLRLLGTNKAVRSISFSTPGQEEKIAALPGDELLLLHAMRGKKQEDLVWIKNQTTNQSHLLQRPGTKARSVGTAAGLITLAVSIATAIVLHIPIDKVFIAIATPSAVGIKVAVTRVRSSKVRDRNELSRLEAEQQLLLQKFDLEQRFEKLNCEFEDNSYLVERLKGLREQMWSADEQLYSRRIAVVSKGIGVLEEQLFLIQKLMTRYQHLINMLAIDYETSRLAEQISSDVSEKMLRQLAELKELEAQKVNLSLLVDPQKLLNTE